ncbi:nuclear transport factor 2 family protein [Pseudonocardia hispaniensis]|uniref:Nuclear transport factor 2 family protein n=1 Tax=Pseudonocardia hispaniensis TaxID=904933 RepID=A0ABW1J4S7_9PSEU
MPTQADRDFYIERLHEVLGKLDRFDVDGAVACFTDDAELVIETDGLRVRGKEAIRAAVTALCAEHEVLEHELTSIVVDVQVRKLASEQIYRGRLTTGKRNEMLNCNFLNFDGDGRISRLITWHAASHRGGAGA